MANMSCPTCPHAEVVVVLWLHVVRKGHGRAVQEWPCAKHARKGTSEPCPHATAALSHLSHLLAGIRRGLATPERLAGRAGRSPRPAPPILLHGPSGRTTVVLGPVRRLSDGKGEGRTDRQREEVVYKEAAQLDRYMTAQGPAG